jgi:hypothetical protein
MSRAAVVASPWLVYWLHAAAVIVWCVVLQLIVEICKVLAQCNVRRRQEGETCRHSITKERKT